VWGIVLKPEEKNKWSFKKNNFGIRSQILAGFAVFAAIIIALLWIFQITLLNSFYKFIKENEVRRTAESVVSHLDEDDLLDTLSNVVRSTGIDIMITNEYGENIINVSSMKSTLFEKLTVSTCAKLYSQTASDGGEQMIKYSGHDNTNMGSQNKNDKNAFAESIVYIKLCTTSDGSSRMLILNTVVTPVDATVDTLKIQLWCLTAVMLLLSFAIALFVSRKISKPIEAINTSAKELAKGDYSISFDEKGSREIVELAKTLNYAGAELSKVENLRRELIANVSHDLRTPLTMITGYSEVMRDIPGENTPENVQIIIDEATRLTSLVNDMLDISKLESGNMKIMPHRMNLTESIEKILTRYDKLADYQFNFYHGDDVYVYADELKISQVVYNLVNNAITYTGDDKSITVTQTVNENMVKIEVTDTGEGIAQDKLKDIWDRYYKVDKQHKRAAVGTGLGLSIVKKILDLHSGEYGVVSTEGKGSTFWFKLNLFTETPQLPDGDTESD
jgi:signal transduction histidine kinase